MEKNNKTTFTLEEQQKAKAFIEVLDANSLTFMVQHMLRYHSDVFLPMITFREVKI